MRARVMPTPLVRTLAQHHRVTPEPAVGPIFGSIVLHEEIRKRNAGRRSSPSSAPYGRGSRETSRARLSASHHGACCSERTPQLNSSDALPGTDCAGAGVTRSLPPQSSELPRRPVIVPAGRYCRSRPGAKVTSPCPREPLSLRQPVSPADVLHGSEIDRLQPAAAMIVKQAARWRCGRSPQVVG
jgi:hypothetical protein